MILRNILFIYIFLIIIQSLRERGFIEMNKLANMIGYAYHQLYQNDKFSSTDYANYRGQFHLGIYPNKLYTDGYLILSNHIWYYNFVGPYTVTSNDP
jgi:hypothetical protein